MTKSEDTYSSEWCPQQAVTISPSYADSEACERLLDKMRELGRIEVISSFSLRVPSRSQPRFAFTRLPAGFISRLQATSLTERLPRDSRSPHFTRQIQRRRGLTEAIAGVFRLTRRHCIG